MKVRILIPVFLLIVLLFIGCCSCGSNGENIVKGKITVIGNEPFARLAIRVENNKAYLLECEKELQDKLINRQGNYYAIQFSGSKVENGIPVLIVEEAIPIEPNLNN